MIGILLQLQLQQPQFQILHFLQHMNGVSICAQGGINNSNVVLGNSFTIDDRALIHPI